MANIESAFQEFLFHLTTPQNESIAAKSHRASIEACLRDKFGLDEYFQSGSFGAGTNIPVHSDVDRFAVIPRTAIPQTGMGALRAVQRAIAMRFPQTRPIRIKPPAIVIPFGIDNREATEIIPAVLVDVQDDDRVYAIPSPSGGPKWILTAPRALRGYINNVDSENDNKLKPLIRLLKYWKYEKKLPIQSIYLELFCARFAQSQKLLTPSFDVARIVNFLSHSKLPAIKPPLDLNDDIPSTKVPGQRIQVLKRLGMFSKISVRALEAEVEWRLPAASNFWKRFFGAKFPSL